ncbi:MAG TPA: ABC transporter permease [Streptosporangiaceae bacterium]|nr:ABC transporter permease [Streptosporangiaceae bacterium]
MRTVLRRLFFYAVTAWAAITLNFILPRLMPGNPAQDLIERFAGKLSPAAIKAIRVLFGQPHTSLLAQYITYWHNVITFNFGISYTYYPTPVVQVIRQSIFWTLILIGFCTVIGFVLGTALGMIVGWRRGNWRDALVPITTFLSSLPYFWFALMVILIFAVTLQWFPSSGGYGVGLQIGFSWSFLSSALYYGTLPALTIVVASVGGWLLGMRNMMITTLNEEYVSLAEAKGLSRLRVMFTYAGRNAVLPSVAGFAMSLGFVVGGAIVTEIVFNYPGIGTVLFQAAEGQDYPLLEAIFLTITIAVLIANLLADLAYIALDPRTREG